MLRLERAQLQLIGEGGTRLVYAHPFRPGYVLKRYKDRPTRGYLATLVGNGEFDAYTIGASQLVEARYEHDPHHQTLLEQPFVNTHDAMSLHALYWELADTIPASARALREPEAVALAFAQLEASGSLMAAAASSSALLTALDTFLANVAAYVTRTGLILDMVGYRNVIYRVDTDRPIDVLDGLKADPLQPERSAEPDLRETVQLLNVCAFFRIIWFLEAITGSSRFADIFFSHWTAAIDRLEGDEHIENLQSARELRSSC